MCSPKYSRIVENGYNMLESALLGVMGVVPALAKGVDLSTCSKSIQFIEYYPSSGRWDHLQ